jgi:transposase-like protein
VIFYLEKPVSGRDYPRNWDQFLDWFPDEDSCKQYLEQLRWPQGFYCYRCGELKEPFRLSRNRLMCRACRYQSTVTAGTVFEKTRTPLRTWLAAAWYITNQKNGVSALGLKRALGLGSYQTAWAIMHRLRRAMVRPDRELLHGIVEVDETFLGGPRSRPRSRSRPGPANKGRQRYKIQDDKLKAVVMIGVEKHQPKGFGRIRMRKVANKTKKSLLSFICDEIEPGSIVHTDGSLSYITLKDKGYQHYRSVQLGSEDPPHISMPGVHRVSSLLKRWLLGTHQGSVQSHQLDYYLDEFTFRFNRRTSRSRGLLFFRLLEQAVVTKPTTYRDIAGK